MRARPRLLVITPDFPPAKGGIQTLSHRVVSALRQFEPEVVTLAHPRASTFDSQQPFSVVRVPRIRGMRAATILALNAAAAAVALRRRPDVVLSWHIVVAPAAAIARRLGVPFAQYVHAKEIRAKPGLARFALTRADRVVAVSGYTKELAFGAGAAPGRVVVINPGVDEAAPVSPNRDGDIRPTVLTIARLEDRYKGHDVVLRALPLVRARVPEVRWQIVGDGPLRPALEDRARALGLDGAVQFLGPVNDESRNQKLADADVFCMVSRLPAGGFAGEGFGIVYLEANAYGLPVVAGGVGGATDAVVDGETGILVDPEDHVAVADAIIRLLRDRVTASVMGRNGRLRAAEFSWAAAAGRLEEELRQLIG